MNKPIQKNIENSVGNNNNQKNEIFSKKKLILLISSLFVSIGLVVVTFLCILKVPLDQFFSDLANGIQAKTWIFILLIIMLCFKALLIAPAHIIRIHALGIKVNKLDAFLYSLSYLFLTLISPANLLTDPFTLFWLKTCKLTNKQVYSILTTNAFIWQVVQIVITLPSYIYLCSQYSLFTTETEDIIIFWMITIGMLIDVGIFCFFGILIFSKKITYYLSISFNYVKKIFKLKYHTKEETKKKYLIRGESVVLSINMLKDYKNSILIFVCYTFIELITYFNFMASINLLLPLGSSTDFIHTFNVINVAATANKFIPIPGNLGSTEYTFSKLIQLFVKVDGVNVDENTANSAILLWRWANLYVPAILGIPTFIYYVIKSTYRVSTNKEKFRN